MVVTETKPELGEPGKVVVRRNPGSTVVTRLPETEAVVVEEGLESVTAEPGVPLVEMRATIGGLVDSRVADEAMARPGIVETSFDPKTVFVTTTDVGMREPAREMVANVYGVGVSETELDKPEDPGTSATNATSATD